jgi:hypothetical protein
MWLHLAAGAVAYVALIALLLTRGYRWQSVKPRAAVAPPAVPADSPEEGNR